MKIIFADTETTGLTDDAQVVEYAHVEVIVGNGAGFQQLFVIERKESLFDPGFPIPVEASNVHGITDDRVAGKPKIADWMAENMPDDYEAHGYNFSRYDMRYLGPHYKQGVTAGCLLKAARVLMPGQPSYKLEELKKALNLPEQPSHRALGDVLTTVDLANYIMEKLGLHWAQLRAEMVRLPVRMPFGKHKGLLIKQLPDDYRQWLLTEAKIDYDLRQALTCQNP